MYFLCTVQYQHKIFVNIIYIILYNSSNFAFVVILSCLDYVIMSVYSALQKSLGHGHTHRQTHTEIHTQTNTQTHSNITLEKHTPSVLVEQKNAVMLFSLRTSNWHTNH